LDDEVKGSGLTLWHLSLKKKKIVMAGCMAQVVEPQHPKHKALSPNPSTTKKKKKKLAKMYESFVLRYFL
jgi:hypothetical protein